MGAIPHLKPRACLSPPTRRLRSERVPRDPQGHPGQVPHFSGDSGPRFLLYLLTDREDVVGVLLTLTKLIAKRV